jgi:ATP-dependent protease ClpP protease subunit
MEHLFQTMDFKFCINPDSDTPVLLLNDYLGVDENGNGIKGSDFARELYELDNLGKKSCEIRINSGGGSVMEGYDIFSAMLQTKMKCDTVNVGVCASMSAIIFQAGRKRTMMDYSLLMFHNPFNEDGSVDSGLIKIKESLVQMVSNKCKKDKYEVSNIFQATTWLNAEESLSNNFCDVIESSSDYNQARQIRNEFDLVKNKDIATLQNQLKNIVNSVKIKEPQIKINKMESINKLLNISIASTEIEAVDSIKTILIDLQTVKNQLTEKENLLKEYQEKEATLKAENARIQANNLVKPFADKGIIKAESVESWVNRAVANFNDTKTILEEISFVKVAPITDVNKVQNQVKQDPFKKFNI